MQLAFLIQSVCDVGISFSLLNCCIVFHFIAMLPFPIHGLLFFGYAAAWGSLVPWPGIKPIPPMELQNFNHWTTSEFLDGCLDFQFFSLLQTVLELFAYGTLLKCAVVSLTKVQERELVDLSAYVVIFEILLFVLFLKLDLIAVYINPLPTNMLLLFNVLFYTCQIQKVILLYGEVEYSIEIWFSLHIFLLYSFLTIFLNLWLFWDCFPLSWRISSQRSVMEVACW